MMAATTNGGGQMALPGPLDVCKTPSPGGPVPLPYPNLSMMTQLQGDTCSDKVRILNKKTAVQGSETSVSTGDEAGTAGGGVVSNRFKGPCQIKSGSSKVKAEGKKVAHLGARTAHNGSNANHPAGAIVVPSQSKVLVMP